MGGSSSKTQVNQNILNEITASVLVQTMAHFSTDVDTSQSLVFQGSTAVGAANIASLTVTQQGIQKVTQDASLINSMAAQIQAKAVDHGVPLIGNSEANINTNIKNQLAAYISNVTKLDCMQKITARQSILAQDSTVIGALNYVSISSLQKCMQDSLASTNFSQSLVANVDASAETSEDPIRSIFEGVSGVIDSVGGIWTWVVLIIAVSVVALAYVFFSSGGSVSDFTPFISSSETATTATPA